jgi:hypothetical protein
MHSFSDCSGCVFFNKHSGETINVRMTVETLQNSLNEYVNLPADERPANVMHNLVEKHFITL